MAVALYATFVLVQTVRHRDYFLPPGGDLPEDAHAEPPSARAAWTSFGVLAVALVGVVFLAKALAPALATIGLTIPGVAVASLLLDLPLALGVDAKGLTLLALSLFVTSLTLVTGSPTVLGGAVHLVIFATYLFTTVVP